MDVESLSNDQIISYAQKARVILITECKSLSTFAFDVDKILAAVRKAARIHSLVESYEEYRRGALEQEHQQKAADSLQDDHPECGLWSFDYAAKAEEYRASMTRVIDALKNVLEDDRFYLDYYGALKMRG